MLRGTDTEVLLKHTASNRFISSVGLIGGSKDMPMPIGEGCALQEDNVTVEFNTPPTDQVETFVKAINYNLAQIADRASKYGLDIAITASATYDEEQLASPAAQTFGCEPDFNAWKKGRKNPKPKAGNPNLRSAGGHLHFSVDNKGKILEYVQACDLFIGMPLSLIDPDKQRRELYGKAGAFRPKPYGFEYRTPSNYWISDERLMRWVWDQMDAAVRFVDEAGDLSDYGDDIQRAINDSDVTVANELMELFEVNDPR